MRRTNLVLDEQMLEQATRLSGEKTYSGAVNLALREFVRLATVHRAYEEIRGAGGWQGDLSEMRRDRSRRKRRSKRHDAR